MRVGGVDAGLGETTTLSLDDGVTDALSAVGVELTATGGAQVETTGGTTILTSPVTGGTVDSFAEQLGLPTLPGLEVDELETTLEGS